MSMLRSWVLCGLVAVGLVACGGGGGGGGGDAPATGGAGSTNPPPTTTQATISGQVTGLAGAELIIQLNNGAGLELTSNSGFTFPSTVTTGSQYSVTIIQQPAHQTCSISGSSGTANTNVSNINVTCSAVPTYSVGVQITGLTVNGLLLKLNGSSNLTPSTSGTFLFNSQLEEGSSYIVTIAQQPANQTCNVISAAAGIISANVNNITINCSDNPTYTVSGQIAGLSGNGLVLQLNGGSNQTINAGSSFAFANRLFSGESYTVAILNQPNNQICHTDSTASGAIVSSNISNVEITCDTPPTYSIGGHVTGLNGYGLVLQLNNNSDLQVDLTSDFEFPVTLPSNAHYSVTVRTNPAGQTCSATSNGNGTVSNNISNISIQCNDDPSVAPNFKLIGNVSGLTKSGLKLQLVVASPTLIYEPIDITAGTTQFSFQTNLQQGADYNVVLLQQPSDLNCILVTQSGAIAATSRTNLGVTCSPRSTAAGLSANKNSLLFSAERGTPVAFQQITTSIQNTSGFVYRNLSHTTNGIQTIAYFEYPGSVGQLTVLPAAVQAGTYHDEITFTACYDINCANHLPGSPLKIPVTTIVHAATPGPVLEISQRAVALTKSPSKSSLTRLINVVDSSSLPSGWTSSSNATWLSATPSGTSGGQLLLTANPSALANGIHEAIVTITSNNNSISPQEVHVGLYVTSSAPATSFAILPAAQNAIYSPNVHPNNSVVDPVRPLIYTASSSEISIDNTYTGARIGVINMAGSSLENLVISDDGKKLYALDNGSPTTTIKVVDISSRAVEKTFTFPQFWNATVHTIMHFTRVSGRAAIVLQDAGGLSSSTPAIDASTGVQLGDFNFGGGFYSLLYFSSNGNALVNAPIGLSGILDFVRSDISLNSKGNIFKSNGKSVFDTNIGGLNTSGAYDVAINADGSKIYVAWSELFVRSYQYSGSSLVDAGNLQFSSNPSPAKNLEISQKGDLIYSSSSAYRLYNDAGALISENLNITAPSVFSTTPPASGDLKFTSDGLRVIANGRILDL